MDFYQIAGGKTGVKKRNHSTVTVNKFSPCCAHSLGCWKALAPALIKTLITGKNRLNGSLKRLLMMFCRTRGNTSLRSGQKIKPGGKGFPQVHPRPESLLCGNPSRMFLNHRWLLQPGSSLQFISLLLVLLNRHLSPCRFPQHHKETKALTQRPVGLARRTRSSSFTQVPVNQWALSSINRGDDRGVSGTKLQQVAMLSSLTAFELGNKNKTHSQASDQ